MNDWMKRKENGQVKCSRTKWEAWWKNDDMSCMDDWIEPWMIVLNACDESVIEKIVCYVFVVMVFPWLLVGVCLMIWVILVASSYVMIVWIFCASVCLFWCVIVVSILGGNSRLEPKVRLPGQVVCLTNRKLLKTGTMVPFWVECSHAKNG